MSTMTKAGPAELSIGRLVRLTARALLLRCPICAHGTLFRSWFREREHCRSCGLMLNRGLSDYFIGGYLVNLIVAELLVVVGLVGVILATWPTVPWTALKWGLVLLVIPAPFLTYPYSKAVWLAIDLHFDPPKPADFVDGKDESRIVERSNGNDATGVDA